MVLSKPRNRRHHDRAGPQRRAVDCNSGGHSALDLAISGNREFHPNGRVQSRLLIWAGDEIVRGVNPWRRCLGAAVASYELAALWL
jgi:hypothetical protein